MGMISRLVTTAFALTTAILAPDARAADQTFGQWVVGMQTNNAGLYASTVNDDGLIFGQYCNFKSKVCFWRIASDDTCEAKDSYPALGNTDQGAASFVLTCGGKIANTDRYIYQFKDWKSLEALLKKSSLLGLAVPLQSDRFKVWRFSLDGMTQANTMMEKVFFEAVSEPASSPRVNTKSSTL